MAQKNWLRRHPKTGIFLAVLLAFFAYSYTWTFTPYGRLDYRAAFSLKLLTFNVDVQPDPGLPDTFNIPLNSFYLISMQLPGEPVSKTEDIQIPNGDHTVPARIYWPKSMPELTSAPPVFVYYHGGGFVAGSVDMFDNLTRAIANITGAIVISVDYRLAPRYPFPAGFDDCYAALQWARDNAARLGGTPDALIVGGDSAGGNFTAGVSLKAAQENGPRLAAQVLYYPATDFTDKTYPSTEHFSDGYGLSTASMNFFHQAYRGHVEDSRTPYLSPLYADSLKGLPPALMVTAGFDPLTDAAHEYAERMKAEGIDVTVAHYPSTVHGFMSIELFSQRREALQATHTFLQRVLPR